MTQLISKDYLMDHVLDVECGGGTYQEAVLLEDIYEAPTIELVPGIEPLTVQQMQEKIKHQAERVNELLEENTDLKIEADMVPRLKRVIDSQHETICTYRNIFMMHEAELKRLREEHNNETD